MSRMPLRNVRIQDDLWAAVQTKAAREDTSVSRVVRLLLADWVSRQNGR